MKQLSNKEQKYRNKIITENHLKKDTQKYIHSYITKNNLTYKYLYFNYGSLHSILVKYNLDKLGNAMKDMGVACNIATNAVKKLATSLSSISYDDLNNNLKKQFYFTR